MISKTDTWSSSSRFQETDSGADRRKADRGTTGTPDQIPPSRRSGCTFPSRIGACHYDLLHHTAVYAPGPCQKAMRMIEALAGADFSPPAWLPGDLDPFEY